MADITYTVNQDDPNNIQGFEQFSQADKNLIGTFTVNSLFDNTKNFAEVHIYSLSDTLLESNYNYSNYKLLGNAQSAGKSGASVLTIDPIEDSKLYGYQYGGIKLLYHFLNDLYTTQKQKVPFYIESISPDRTEVRLQSLELTTDEIRSYTADIKDKLANQSYFNEFRLNFENNDLLIAINIDVLDSGGNSYVVVKLYEPLPSAYGLKSTTYVNEVVSDSVIFEVDSAIELPQEQLNALRPANFNLDVADYSVTPTGYYSYNDLFSYPVNNTNSQVFSLVNEKGAELSIDHTDYNDFVHFSSAYERLLNFKYKLQLIQSYSSSLSQITNQTSQSIGVTGSSAYYNNLTQGILSNFDHYERYLYYESSSYAWPKVNSTTPYVNYSTTSSIGLNWYSNQLANANGYDLSNQNLLTNTIPTYISDDDANQNYLTFVHMIGQHFDNLWIYAKAVSDKYDGDNRLDFGISKDLVGEALRNFGVKLYTSNKSIQDLFASFIGQSYQSGSEVINNYITGSITGSNLPTQPIPYDNYNKEVQKRIYHNLSHLLKTKGTERGVRALINCFGIPSNMLKIKTYGGRNVNETPFFGDYEYYTSSLDKIRVDNTGSIVEGDALSGNVSIVKRDKKYTDDLHNVEIGFSPTDNIDNLIVSYSMATASLNTFNIDQYIGDPRNLHLDAYNLLDTQGDRISDLTDLTNTIMSSSAAYDVYDYVRLIKFFDNTVFKTVKDFLPARVVADTGIIIKPHVLSRSKAKSVTTTGTDEENLFTASIDTAFIAGTNGSTFGSTDQYNTRYIETIQTPFGLGTTLYHNQQEAKYDGELSGSQLTITNGNLTEGNPYTITTYVESTDNLQYISGAIQYCNLTKVYDDVKLVHESDGQYSISQFFQGGLATGVTYQIQPTTPTGTAFSIPLPYIFPESIFNQYDTFSITATDSNFVGCTATVNCMYGKCDIKEKVESWGAPAYPPVIIIDEQTQPVNLLTTYFTIGSNHSINNLQVVVTKNPNTFPEILATLTGIQAQTFLWTNYQFDNNDEVVITCTDTVLLGGCTSSVTITVVDCSIADLPIETYQGSIGKYEFSGVSSWGNIIQGGTQARGDTTNIPPVGCSPIHHPSYQYPNDSITYDMRKQFPYLTNPNYIFENPDGSPRPVFPTITTGVGVPSDLSGDKLGLASFFTGLGSLTDIQYEVYIYYMQYFNSIPFGSNSDPNESGLLLSFSDGHFGYGGEGASYTISSPAIKPGLQSERIVNIASPIDDLPTSRPMWTYTTPSPNAIGGQLVQGQVAELNLEALRYGLSGYPFGERIVFSDQQHNTGNFDQPFGFYVKIYAYSGRSSEPGDFTCYGYVGVAVESWIKRDSDISQGSGGGQ